MKRHSVTAGILALSVSLQAPAPLLADAGDVFGGIVGGIIGGAIVSGAQKQRTVKKVYRAPTVNTAQREQNRQVQTALNYFGFPAGVADGVMGRNSRAAVSGYQAHMGFPATGQLAQFERDFLLRSYSRAQAGGYATQQMVASLTNGPRGLLHHYRSQEAQTAGMVPQTVPPQPLIAAQPVAPAPAAPAPSGYVTTTTVVAPAPQPQATAPAPQTAAAPTPQAPPQAAPVETAATGLAVPNFLAGSKQTSVTAHCNMVNLRTSSSGGFVQVSSLSDPKVALDEQFCLARTYAIAQGDELISKVQGVNPEQIEQQCKQFGPLLKDQIAALSFKSPADVSHDVEQFVVASGVPPQQLTGTAQICLAVGYRTDDIDTVLASSLLLNVLGAKPYAELLGHHILNGLGPSEREDLALAWYASALDAIDKGAQPVFNPGMPERQMLLKASVSSLSGAPTPGQTTVPTPTTAALPTFSIAQ